jgi:hypothetical protein
MVAEFVGIVGQPAIVRLMPGLRATWTRVLATAIPASRAASSTE